MSTFEGTKNKRATSAPRASATSRGEVRAAPREDRGRRRRSAVAPAFQPRALDRHRGGSSNAPARRRFASGRSLLLLRVLGGRGRGAGGRRGVGRRRGRAGTRRARETRAEVPGRRVDAGVARARAKAKKPPVNEDEKDRVFMIFFYVPESTIVSARAARPPSSRETSRVRVSRAFGRARSDPEPFGRSRPRRVSYDCTCKHPFSFSPLVVVTRRRVLSTRAWRGGPPPRRDR
jgi:hypothetical protein